MDFKAKREQAEAAAQPHWTNAEQLNNEASALDNRIRDLRESIKGVTDKAQRQVTDDEIEQLRSESEKLLSQKLVTPRLLATASTGRSITST